MSVMYEQMKMDLLVKKERKILGFPFYLDETLTHSIAYLSIIH